MKSNKLPTYPIMIPGFLLIFTFVLFYLLTSNFFLNDLLEDTPNSYLIILFSFFIFFVIGLFFSFSAPFYHENGSQIISLLAIVIFIITIFLFSEGLYSEYNPSFLIFLFGSAGLSIGALFASSSIDILEDIFNKKGCIGQFTHKCENCPTLIKLRCIRKTEAGNFLCYGLHHEDNEDCKYCQQHIRNHCSLQMIENKAKIKAEILHWIDFELVDKEIMSNETKFVQYFEAVITNNLYPIKTGITDNDDFVYYLDQLKRKENKKEFNMFIKGLRKHWNDQNLRYEILDECKKRNWLTPRGSAEYFRLLNNNNMTMQKLFKREKSEILNDVRILENAVIDGEMACSFCHTIILVSDKYNEICPNCGGKLDVSKDDRLNLLHKKNSEFFRKVNRRKREIALHLQDSIETKPEIFQLIEFWSMVFTRLVPRTEWEYKFSIPKNFEKYLRVGKLSNAGNKSVFPQKSRNPMISELMKYGIKLSSDAICINEVNPDGNFWKILNDHGEISSIFISKEIDVFKKDGNILSRLFSIPKQSVKDLYIRKDSDDIITVKLEKLFSKNNIPLQELNLKIFFNNSDGYWIIEDKIEGELVQYYIRDKLSVFTQHEYGKIAKKFISLFLHEYYSIEFLLKYQSRILSLMDIPANADIDPKIIRKSSIGTSTLPHNEKQAILKAIDEKLDYSLLPQSRIESLKENTNNISGLNSDIETTSLLIEELIRQNELTSFSSPQGPDNRDIGKRLDEFSNAIIDQYLHSIKNDIDKVKTLIDIEKPNILIPPDQILNMRIAIFLLDTVQLLMNSDYFSQWFYEFYPKTSNEIYEEQGNGKKVISKKDNNVEHENS